MIAFVLSGGGSLGAVQAGMLEALLERDIVPGVLVGTSIGAANAAFLAAEPTLPRAQALSDLWRSLTSREIFPLGPVRTLRALFKDGSLFATAPLRRLIERNSPYSSIERALVPLRIVATDFVDGAEVVFDSGPVADAVLASTALPGVFPPHRVSGRLYLDGGDHPEITIVSLPPVCSHAGLRDLGRAASLIEQARDQTRLFLSGQPCDTCAHESSRRSDTAPVEEVVRLPADLSVA